MTYTIVEIFTREEVRWHGQPLSEAIVQLVAKEKTAARCLVTRAIAGCFENGEVATHRIVDLSYNLPVKIEVVLPPAELHTLLPRIEEMVTDGIVLVRDAEMRLHHTTGELLPRSLRVRDVMTSSPVSVKPGDRVREVFSVLVRSEFDSVPVTDADGRLVGMVGQEELVEKTGLHATSGVLAALWQGPAEDVPEAELAPPEAAQMTAQQVMTGRVPTTGADDLLVDAVRVMVKQNLKRLPVLDGDRRLVGMLARIDVLRTAHAASSRRRVCEHYGASVPGTMPVGEADLLDVPTVSPATPVRHVLDMFDREARRVVVVGEQGAPLGVLSDRDLLPLLDPKNKKKLDGLTAGSLMRTVPTIRRDANIEEALVWMVEHRRQRLPVVDAEGRYVGMLSREELLRIVLPQLGTPHQR